MPPQQSAKGPGPGICVSTSSWCQSPTQRRVGAHPHFILQPPSPGFCGLTLERPFLNGVSGQCAPNTPDPSCH